MNTKGLSWSSVILVVIVAICFGASSAQPDQTGAIGLVTGFSGLCIAATMIVSAIFASRDILKRWKSEDQ